MFRIPWKHKVEISDFGIGKFLRAESSQVKSGGMEMGGIGQRLNGDGNGMMN